MQFDKLRVSLSGVDETQISFEAFCAELPDFSAWFIDRAPFSTNSIKYFCWFSKFNQFDKVYYAIYLYSSHYEYRIVIDKNNYIGASYLTRKVRPGENHHRGRDLSDGDYSLRTIHAILLEICSHLFEPLDE